MGWKRKENELMSTMIAHAGGAAPAPTAPLHFDTQHEDLIVSFASAPFQLTPW